MTWGSNRPGRDGSPGLRVSSRFDFLFSGRYPRQVLEPSSLAREETGMEDHSRKPLAICLEGNGSFFNQLTLKNQWSIVPCPWVF